MILIGKNRREKIESNVTVLSLERKNETPKTRNRKQSIILKN
jgi:hypothetical protein